MSDATRTERDLKDSMIHKLDKLRAIVDVARKRRFMSWPVVPCERMAGCLERRRPESTFKEWGRHQILRQRSRKL